MPKITKILNCLFIVICVLLLTDCASAKQNPYQQKRNAASRVNTSQLGRNKYYFSNGYQKKLVHNYRKK